MIIRLASIEVPVAAGGTSAPLPYRWPQTGLISSFYFAASDGAPGSCAELQIEITDERQEAIFVDGTVPVFVPSQALMGRGFRWFRLNRWVKVGHVWTFRFRSTAARDTRRPQLLVHLQEVGDPDRPVVSL